jgi:protoheme IX farnesyltransferase
MMPVGLGMSGWVYCIISISLNLGFMAYAVALYRNYSDDLAKRTFKFSIIYLMALFAGLLLDHYFYISL